MKVIGKILDVVHDVVMQRISAHFRLLFLIIAFFALLYAVEHVMKMTIAIQ
ncbi:MAG: hypothetical protein JW861_08440 [Bacteroidales bacterium]|nr:hypothetical protein [Bacteroidales bacterium]